VGENGFYILFAHLIDTAFAIPRNYLISRKLGIKRVKIGPRAYLRGLSAVSIGEDFAAEQGLWLEAIHRYNDQRFTPRIVIGEHVRISHFVHIAATHFVEIGDNVLMGSKVIITDHNHGLYSRRDSSPMIPPVLRPLDDDQKVFIGRNVWLGDGVVVTPGSSIGEGAVIGANSVVLGSIPPFTIAAGAPAIVRKTFDFETSKWSNVE
jgi:acetyltransferase-like isoleucine patch superfamily enzyme